MRTIFSVMALGSCSIFSTQAASRLSRNAATPSAPSLRIWRANACAARSRMGPRSTSAHCCSSALVAAFAPGAQRAMPWRTATSLASRAVASSATKSTRPMRCSLRAVDALAREREPARARLADARDDEGRDLRRHQAQRGFAEREFCVACARARRRRRRRGRSRRPWPHPRPPPPAPWAGARARS